MDSKTIKIYKFYITAMLALIIVCEIIFNWIYYPIRNRFEINEAAYAETEKKCDKNLKMLFEQRIDLKSIETKLDNIEKNTEDLKNLFQILDNKLFETIK